MVEGRMAGGMVRVVEGSLRRLHLRQSGSERADTHLRPAARRLRAGIDYHRVIRAAKSVHKVAPFHPRTRMGVVDRFISIRISFGEEKSG
jgi:hypothetical protein